jgi:hypothetical protein
LRLLESQAAVDYWGAWRDLDVVFVQRDFDRVPEHWRTFGVRRSLITGTPRKATNPANAILNYLYSILEAEARIAAFKLGLDPGLGVAHADLKARDSFVCDLMESVRPEVDGYVLELLENRVFWKTDFFETRSGLQADAVDFPRLSSNRPEMVEGPGSCLRVRGKEIDARDAHSINGVKSQRGKDKVSRLTVSKRDSGQTESRILPD